MNGSARLNEMMKKAIAEKARITAETDAAFKLGKRIKAEAHYPRLRFEVDEFAITHLEASSCIILAKGDDGHYASRIKELFETDGYYVTITADGRLQIFWSDEAVAKVPKIL